MYDLILSDKARKQLEKLDKQTQERIGAALERIKIRPEVHLVKLVDDSGYKLRVGDYRLIIDFDRSRLLLLVIKLGHRKNVYD